MTVRSMRGQVIDMAALAAKNATKVAIGNASMNARGDLIGPGGRVIKTREQMTRDYNADNPKAVKQTSLRSIKTEVFVSPAEAVAIQDEAKRTTKRKIADTN